ncbi:ATP-binding protein [soil metagenome]
MIVRSFRAALALRFALLAVVGMTLCVVATWFAVRHILDAELDASILNVASIQAAALTDHEAGEMRFHEWELTPEEAASITELIRYAQVWSEPGESLLRSRYMLRDLPMDREALALAARGELVWREADFGAYRVRSVFYPLVRLGQLHDEHVLQVAAPLHARDAMLQRVALFGLVLVVLTGLGGMLGGRWLASRTLRPVNAIIEQAEGVGAANLSRRISAYADTSEYQRLVQVLNTMLDRIRDSFEAQRRFTADASHELRTPLTSMRGEIELALRRDRDVGEYRHTLESALEEVLRMGRIVEGLLTLARADAGAIDLQMELHDLGALAEEAVERARGIRRGGAESGTSVGAGQPEVTITVEVRGDPVGRLDGRLMVQAIWNLVMNAHRFAGDGGSVRVSVIRAGDRGVIQVLDSGPGLLADEVDRVFDRFWQADASRTQRGGSEGVGLGLSIVQAIVRAHGGSLTVEASGDLGGAAFRIEIPLTT